MRLSGKDIHEIYMSLCNSPVAWNELSPSSQQAYDDVAATITSKHIMPMQTLLIDIHTFILFDNPLRRFYYRDWKIERDALLLRARELIHVGQ